MSRTTGDNTEKDWATRPRDGSWATNLRALELWSSSHGTPMAPSTATVTVDDRQVRVGSFVAYVRHRYRKGLLDGDRAAQLERFAGWTWGTLPPGPKGEASRNERIRTLRREGYTLTELADTFGMSRQRIHQIAPDAPDPEAHARHLARRRAERKRRFEAEREALARRAGGV